MPVYLDTMGYAFTFPVFKYLGGSRIACYVHYPTISTDMLAKVSSGDASFNNAAASGSAIRTRLKLVYYNAFAKLYSLMGNRAELIMANSSWTRGHIVDIWKRQDVNLVFPACDTTTLQAFPLQPRENLLVSVAQFRSVINFVLNRSIAPFLVLTDLPSILLLHLRQQA
jgi:alpha-1,2-mannosyltransferase